MTNSFRLAFAYLKYYKKQTITLLLGIILSASLLTGIGSLLGSGRAAALENAREKYGDWHYTMRCDYEWFTDFQKAQEQSENQGQIDGKGFRVEKSGVLTIRKELEEPYAIVMAYADSDYLDIMGRKITEGCYPEHKNEVAMDEFTLRNLDIPAKTGSKVILDGEEFILSGIMSDMAESDTMQVFVNQDLDYGKNGKFLYLKFNESRKAYKQIKNFSDTFGVDIKTIARNNAVVKLLGGNARVDLAEVLKTGITMEGAGLPYIWGSLNDNWNLTDKAILAAIGLFCAFIIFSLFQISVIKRMSQYSMMQAVGMEDRVTFSMLAAELLLIFLVGYPIGCLLGNGAASILYARNGQIFIPAESYQIHSGTEREAFLPTMPSANTFHISGTVILGGALFLLFFILLIAGLLVRRMRKLTTRELLAKDNSRQRKSRKIYSTKTGNLTGVLTRKFMFARKGAFISILFSLSAGSLIFLGTAYVTENTKIHNELSFKADDGLGSDIQAYEESDSLADTIPESAVKQLKEIEGIKTAYPVRYMLGEIPFPDGSFLWTTYYAEVANEKGFEPDAELMEKYNGVAVQTGEDDYRIKVNIYGYDDDMLLSLNDYLLEGAIEPDKMRSENTVIFKTLMGGQGTYEGVDLSLGDKIQLKTPVNAQVAPDVLRFLADDNQYQEKEFGIVAITSRPLSKVDTFIGDNGSDRVDIIMTNEQMERNFGVTGYQTVSISLDENADAAVVSDEIQKVISDVSKCVVKDYTRQIETQNLFLAKKMMFFYGVALIILVISLLHIMNSMQYLVAARKHEFGILRAMGITDTGFRKMLVKEGLRYGLYSSGVMVVAYLIVQKFLYYFVVRVLLYLHPKASLSLLPILGMVGINILICIAAVWISGQAVLKQQIIEEIRE